MPKRAGVRIPFKMGEGDLSLQAEDESVILFFTVNTHYLKFVYEFFMRDVTLETTSLSPCHRVSRLA